METGIDSSLIEVRHLSKNFGFRSVLRDINFQADAGEMVVLLGANGAGKTTFLRLLATLIQPGKGEVRVADCRLPVQSLEARSQVGVLLHQPLLYPSLSAEENLRFYGRLYQVPDLELRIDDLLQQTGLAARRRERVAVFSRGMQQRLALARAALHAPRVYLLDEPYSGLDPQACAWLDEFLTRTAAQGATVLLTTHELERAANLAARFDVLHRGVIAASCSRSDLPGGDAGQFYQGVLQGE